MLAGSHVDAEEALAPVAEIRAILAIAFGITIALALAAWLLYLDPLARRLKRASRAAARVAAGDYTLRLADPDVRSQGDPSWREAQGDWLVIGGSVGVRNGTPRA